MRILVAGAAGFIGGAILRALRREGLEAVAAVRSAADAVRLSPAVRLDLGALPPPGELAALLSGFDALINCAGVFADGPGASTDAVHDAGPRALFAACVAAGVSRVVHFSAIGAPREASPFSRSKHAGDEALAGLDLDWVILRPALVLGAEARGGAALVRALAALPFAPVDESAGDIQTVAQEDVVAAALFFLRPEAPTRLALDLAAPERIGFANAIGRIRAWLGLRAAPVWRAPLPLMRLVYAAGDLTGALGWRHPLRSAARAELQRGATGDSESWQRVTGIAARSMAAILEARPATAQDRLAARLYFLTPLILAVTALFFIGTGLVSLGPGYEIGVSQLRSGGLGGWSGPSVIAGAFADILVGLAVAWRPTVRLGLHAALAISLFYFIAGSILLPELWRDPIGPMLKIFPLMTLNVVGLALTGDRR